MTTASGVLTVLDGVSSSMIIGVSSLDEVLALFAILCAKVSSFSL
jgi:hypothetical protein